MLDPFGSIDNKMIPDNLEAVSFAWFVLVILPARYHYQLVAAIREHEDSIRNFDSNLHLFSILLLCSSACLRCLNSIWKHETTEFLWITDANCETYVAHL